MNARVCHSWQLASSPLWLETQPPSYAGRQFSRTIRESDCSSDPNNLDSNLHDLAVEKCDRPDRCLGRHGRFSPGCLDQPTSFAAPVFATSQVCGVGRRRNLIAADVQDLLNRANVGHFRSKSARAPTACSLPRIPKHFGSVLSSLASGALSREPRGPFDSRDSPKKEKKRAPTTRRCTSQHLCLSSTRIRTIRRFAGATTAGQSLWL